MIDGWQYGSQASALSLVSISMYILAMRPTSTYTVVCRGRCLRGNSEQSKNGRLHNFAWAWGHMQIRRILRLQQRTEDEAALLLTVRLHARCFIRHRKLGQGHVGKLRWRQQGRHGCMHVADWGGRSHDPTLGYIVAWELTRTGQSRC